MTDTEYLAAKRDRDVAAMELKELQQVQPTNSGPAEIVAGGLAPGPDLPTLPHVPARDAKPVLIPTAQAHPEDSPRAAEMRTIVLAGLEYATEHPDWPGKLDELKPKYLDAGKTELGQFVYYPLSGESLLKNPQEAAVLVEKAPAFAGGRLVGFADGYIDFIRDPERLKRVIPAEAKPQPVLPEKL